MLPLQVTQAQLSIATAYRYLHEALDVIAAHAPDPVRRTGPGPRRRAALRMPGRHLIPTDRVAARAEGGHHRRYSGKHHAFGGNVQVLCDSGDFPLWASDVLPGSNHDLTAARGLVRPTLYPHAVRGLPILADKGYTGAGIGGHVRSSPS